MFYFGLVCVLLAANTALIQPPGNLKVEPRKRIAIHTDTLYTTHELIGPLGKPLGEVLTVTGTVHQENSKLQEIYLEITEVDGNRLTKPKEMYAHLWRWGSNIKELKPGQRLTAKVYQDGGMTGLPQFEGMAVQSKGYTFSTWLVVLNEVGASK